VSAPRYWFPFMLNWELDMLECALYENYDRVHRFVLVEATLTHQGRPKPLYYDDNKSRFEAYSDKIIHVVCDYLPTYEQMPDPWVRERMQRDAGLMAYVPQADPDDIIIVSDLDEIPSTAAFAQDPQPFLGGNIYLRFATVDTPGSPGVMQVLARAGAVGSVDQLRQRREALPSYDQAGWHLSWLGGQDRIREKTNCFAHLEAFEASHAANDANVMWKYGMGRLSEDGLPHPAPVLDIPWVKTREERDALPWGQQSPLWVHQRLCPDVWWRPAEGYPGAV
jgi:Glycosyltransferase family 17